MMNLKILGELASLVFLPWVIYLIWAWTNLPWDYRLCLSFIWVWVWMSCFLSQSKLG